MTAPVFAPPLKKGDTIGVFAPSSYVERADIEKSAALLESKGYKVFVHPQTYERLNQSAGDHLQKSLAFQGLWQRADISAIWAAGGGNRAMHLIDTINFEKLKGKPKPFIGFSDVTPLLNAVTAHTGIVTYHGPVFKNLHKYQELDHLLDLLAGKKSSWPVKAANIKNHGKAKGRLVGGNLSLFQYLPQTLPADYTDGAILFLEDCNEDISKIDRMLLHLKRLGVFKNAAAIVFGEFTNMTDTGRPFGFTMRDIIDEHTDGLDIPILIDMPFGHGKNLYAFPNGAEAVIDTKKKSFVAKAR